MVPAGSTQAASSCAEAASTVRGTARFDLLLQLIENRDRIVTRDEIIEKIWKGRIVLDAAIWSRVKAARQAVGDNGRPIADQDLHRRGIRFVGEVRIEKPFRPSPRISWRRRTRARRRRPPVLPGAGRTETPAVPPVARDHVDMVLASVSPDSTAACRTAVYRGSSLSNAGREEADQIVSNGLSLDIMTGLARTRSMFVISRGTAFMFRGAAHDARSVSEKLGVRYVLHGSIHLRGRQTRIHAALTDAIAGSETWANHFTCSIGDIFEVQDGIVGDIIGAVEAEIEHSERRRALLASPSSLDAWSAYHRGSWHMYQFTREGYVEAERLFKLAAKLDPNASRVFAGLSFVHWQRAFLEIGTDREGEI